MFWRLILLPGKQLTSVVDQSFHLTMAALDIATVKNPDEVQAVYLEIDGSKTILCNLSKKQAMQVNLDLVFLQGTKMALSTSGSASVHLTGHIIIQEGEEQEFLSVESKRSKSPKSADVKSNSKLELPAKRKKESQGKLKNQLSAAKKVRASISSSNDDHFNNSSDIDDVSTDSSLSDYENGDQTYDSEDDSDTDSDNEFGSDDSGDDDEMGSSGLEPEDEEDIHRELKKTSDATDKSKKKNKQGKGDQKVTPDKRQSLNKSGNNQDTVNPHDNKAKLKTPQGESKRENNTQSQTPQSLQKKKIEGGVTVQELKTGTGPVAKAGKSVVVFYVGRIGNKEFDRSQRAPGFKFRLGRGEVIKGWDVGLLGMKVGGKRRITCPPNMAYGQKGSPPTIPPNSTLVFDIELKSVS